MAGSDLVTTVKGWINQITGVAVSLIALAVVLQVLFGETVIFLPVDVVGNITGLVASLGSQGLVGLVALGVIYWIFTKRD
jgi:small-conductance mechanosensitive channel|tara:strand:+ start:517 stop:756 length:240 start_codon:yes stop_codon:yes gene_type:complete